MFGEDSGVTADFSGKNVSKHNFSDALLMSAKFKSAIFKNCDFTQANLTYINADGASFLGCNLRHADFSRSSLSGVNFEGSNLNGVIGNGKELISINTDRWPVAYTATHMQIGCEQHKIQDWWKFSDDEIDAMDKRGLVWWKKWKEVLKRAVEKNPAIADAA